MRWEMMNERERGLNLFNLIKKVSSVKEEVAL